MKIGHKFFTVCNVAYLDKVFALAQSVFENEKIKLDVFIFDTPRELSIDSEVWNLIWVEEMEFPEYSHHIAKYSVIELTTAYKPFIAQRLLDEAAQVTFLDPDTYLFTPLTPILENTDGKSVILTPHFLTPNSVGPVSDATLMRFGIYNLGFFSVIDDALSREFLSWWSDRCLENAYDDPQFGIFTDQKWVSIAELFFDCFHVERDPGINVAYWNLKERYISVDGENNYIVNNEVPLRLFHFSAVSLSSEPLLSKKEFDYGATDGSILRELIAAYNQALSKFPGVVDSSYAYDYMDDGRYISPVLRRAAATCGVLNCQSPFSVGSPLYEFAARNHLFEKDDTPYKARGYGDIQENTNKFKLVFLFIRLFVRIFGPNKLQDLTRLFVYLSRLHTVPEIWKK